MAHVGLERRSQRRAVLPATATVVKAGAPARRFVVANLSAAGALLIGDSELGRGDLALVRLEPSGAPPLLVQARVVRGGNGDGVNALAVEFRHPSPDTEDAIHDVLLDALEEEAKSRPGYALESARV